MKFLETKIPAPIVAAVMAGMMKGYTYGGGVVVDPSPILTDLAIGLAQVSAVIAIWAFATFWRAKTSINPLVPAKASTLVARGVFRFSRNPMYLSLLLLLIAYALRIDAWVVWLGPTVFVLYVTYFQIIPEERILARKFGDEFMAYRLRTRRWI